MSIRLPAPGRRIAKISDLNSTRLRASHHARQDLEALEQRVLLSDSLQINTGQILNSITDNFLGVNYVAFWDSAQGDAKSMQALKNAGVQVLRFGGGEPGNWYNWADPLYKGWSSTTPASLITYAKGVGAQLLLETNPTTNGDNNPSAASAAGWVSSMKSQAYQAPYWEVGNENDGAGNNGVTGVNSNYDWSKYQSYLNTWNAQAAAMHLADPSIKIYGNTGTNDYYWWQIHSLDMFLNKTGNRFGTGQVDGVSVHYYPGVPGNATFAQVAANAQTIPARITAVTQMTAQQDTRNLPIAITETSAADGNGAGSIVNQMGSALANADLIGAYKAAGVQQVDWFGSIHSVSNSWGFLYGTGDIGTLDQAAPKYWMLPIWAHTGNIVLGQTGVTDASNTLSAYATLNANGNVEEVIINKTNAARSVNVSFSGFDPTGKQVKIYSLVGATGAVTDSSIVYNGVTNPDATSASGLPAPTNDTATSSIYTRSVPAYSITLLDFQVNSNKLIPVARVSSPGNTDLIDAGSAIKLGADAISQAGDGITKVEFYANSVLVGTATSGSNNNFSTGWSNVSAGTYTIYAKAYDTNGATSSSAPVSVTVSARAAYSTLPVVPASGQVIIQAENFDKGGEGWGYHDLDSGTSTYRSSDKVQLATSTDTGGGYDVTTTRNSEWLAYSISVTQAGTYSLGARVNSATTIGGHFHFDVDGTNVSGSIAVPYTGSTYASIGVNGIGLSAGSHVVHLVMEDMVPTTNGSVANFNYLSIQNTAITVSAPAAPALSGTPSDQHVALAWNLVAGATSFNLYRGTTSGKMYLYRTGLTSTSFTDSGLTDGASYYYQVTAVNSGGESVASNQVAMIPQITIPAPWVAGDVGSPTTTGYSNFASNIFTVNGAGTDIWNGADQFQFVYQPVTNDCTIVAHVASQSSSGAAWAKAGVMIRQDLSTGALNANMVLNPSGWAMMDTRTTVNGGTGNTNTGTSGIYVPNWIKLVRAANVFTGYYSTDGTNWLKAGTASTSITMTGTVYIGLSVCSTITSTLSQVVFDHVTVTGTQVLPGTATLTSATPGASKIALLWNAVPGANSYKIYRGTASGAESLYQSGITATSYSDSVTNGTTYYYQITAVNSVGESTAKSNELSATAANPSPLALSGSSNYMQLDADPRYVDVWNSTTNTGNPNQHVLLNLVSSMSFSGNGASLTVDFSNGNPLASGGFNFTGGANSTLKIIGSSSIDTIVATASSISLNAGTITFSNTSNLVVDPGTGADSLSVTGITLSLPAAVRGGGLVTRLFSTLNVGTNGKLIVPTATNLDGTIDRVDQTQLFVSAGFSDQGTLDLGGNLMVVQTGNLSTINNLLSSGFNNGAWTGAGINSSATAGDTTGRTGLSTLPNNINGITGITWLNGQPLSPTDVLVKTRYYGDTNWDGKIDGTDYSRIDAGYVSPGTRTGWSNGDFNYDGKIDGTDYALMDAGYGANLTALPAALVTSPAGVIAMPQLLPGLNPPAPPATFFGDDQITSTADEVVNLRLRHHLPDWTV